jgi:hypothetical protein
VSAVDGPSSDLFAHEADLLVHESAFGGCCRCRVDIGWRTGQDEADADAGMGQCVAQVLERVRVCGLEA